MNLCKGNIKNWGINIFRAVLYLCFGKRCVVPYFVI
jgi:hypothetical protein